MSTSETPRLELVVELMGLMYRYQVTPAGLHAAVDRIPIGQERRNRGHPKSELYNRLGFGMAALIMIYRRHPFTAAKQLLSAAETPVGQRDNQARALVRQFYMSCDDDLMRQITEFYAKSSASERVRAFWFLWKQTGLPWPPGVISPSDCHEEFRRIQFAAEDETAAMALEIAWWRTADQSLADVDLSSS